MDVGVDVEEDVGGLWADGPTDDECMRPLSRPGGPGGQSLKRKSGGKKEKWERERLFGIGILMRRC